MGEPGQADKLSHFIALHPHGAALHLYPKAAHFFEAVFLKSRVASLCSIPVRFALFFYANSL